ncbi:MAG: PAS domain-containing protein, partial [Candidatus Competibacter sp.]|nr:PAS domain-containing protein [Candidatus Competibacter sp.]
RPDGSACFPYASPAIEDLYGLRAEELAESAAPLWAMVHPDDLGHLDANIAASAHAMIPWRDEFRVRHPTKGEIWIEGHSMPVYEPDGSILWHGYVQDVTDRKRAETALRAALAEKEVLLREVHHRVKNNLAAIVHMLELQGEAVAEAPTASLLVELSYRIRSMALIHEMLYRSESFSQIDFRGYLQELVAHLHAFLDPQNTIRLEVVAPEIWMDLDTAIPCGLIVNELVTNAFKHAFPDSRSWPESGIRKIVVAADQNGARYTLTVADNGAGLSAQLDWRTTRTLGLRLVRMLGQHQLRGQIELDSTDGTRFSLRFGDRQELKVNPHDR